MDNASMVFDLAFSYAPGIGPLRYKQLVEYFSSSQKAYEASEKSLLEVLPSQVGGHFIAWRKQYKSDTTTAELKKKGIFVVNQSHPQYPQDLLHISDPPICLYIRTNEIENLSRFNSDLHVAIVGSRKHSSYGRTMTVRIATDMAVNKIVVVSGMALGIDAIAHIGTLDAYGNTLAILGCGVDVIYPQDNTHLYERILRQGGVLMSEFTPGTHPIPGYFIARNRLVAGISKAVIIIEGAKDSGSLTTARIAAEQGKDVYALPGEVTSPHAEAPLILLKQGARLITDASDVLEDLGLSQISASKQNIVFENLIEQSIYEYIRQNKDVYPDELANKLHIEIAVLTTHISKMEIRGILKRDLVGSLSI
ncbi:MAG: DNA-processing protein DprA [Candidatus Roizmanbacteria bacterium]